MELKLRTLLDALYLHVAAMPWADEGFNRSVVAQKAARDSVVEFTISEITKLKEENHG